MDTLQEKAKDLISLSFKLMHLGEDGQDVYSDDLSKLDTTVRRMSDALFLFRGCTAEEEASCCLSLLMSYQACMFIDNRATKLQSVLDRCENLFDKLPVSLLKCELLTYYNEYNQPDAVD